MAASSKAASVSATEASFASLLTKIQYLDAPSIELVRKAYRWADELHLGQMRHSGDPYITHPLTVTGLCADWKLDAQALCAALLHDALEDCGIAKRDIIERFGSTVADLVDGLTKLEKLPVTTREENQAESFRKMLLAMASDVRVILIKLADRTHNMRTLGDSPPAKWMRIATETQDIYAPIAHRLGLNQTYRELQDLSFKYLKPWRYQTLTQATAKARARARDLIQRGKKDLETAFQQAKIPATISGREKTLFSIYKKMRTKHVNFSDINDLFGFRVIVDNQSACYTALGVLHHLYKPVPGRFKDHIAIPKANGYQSLHTTLVGPSGVTVEFQIRTQSMHWVAESGVAAHWLYKTQGHGLAAGQAGQHIGAHWLESLLDIQNETIDASEFWDHVKVDLFPDAVYVFTPKNKIYALPRGATVVDFAYAVHSTIGDRCMSAKVNGDLAPLRTELKNGDRIEIITAPVSQPNPAWLSFVRTGRARSKIRHFMKTQAQSQSLAMGEKLLLQALRQEGYAAIPGSSPSHKGLWDKALRFTGNKSTDELLVDIGLGKRMATVVANRLAKLLTEQGQTPDPLLLASSVLLRADAAANQLIVDGNESVNMVMATCCHPIAQDAIVGYLGHGEGLIIHRKECTVAARLVRKDADRMMPAVWSDDIDRNFIVSIQIDAADGQGVLAQITAALAAADANIVHIDMVQEPTTGIADLRLRITVHDAPHLKQVLASLARVKAVLKATRV
ncbi:MAG: bifunctional (p)ppGpp synthetase/guanosine-3',5'-bis(diphosphate) 3'-pyrophosphohydrolase [Cytophagales bacterium]|nr:bifunctional (p)ppGpp synthetase/guanosine-3',5'-bis(diphosphate) 3'-pyrophosphohydrolase [Cytophagales bacterium]